MFPRGGESSERTEEPNQIQAGPQGPRSMADEGVKGVMMVDSPPHQPQKKAGTGFAKMHKERGQLRGKFAGTENMRSLFVNGLAVNDALPL